MTRIRVLLSRVGDSENFLVRILGGAAGAGLVTRIVRGYTVIFRNFETGDRIYIVGFSRGSLHRSCSRRAHRGARAPGPEPERPGESGQGVPVRLRGVVRVPARRAQG